MTGADPKRFAAVIEGLSSRNREEKLLSVMAIGIIKAPEHADLLVDLLSSPDEEIVEQIIITLGRIKNPKSAKYILGFVNSDNPKYVDRAISALSGFNLTQVLDVVMKAAGPERPPTVRRKVINLIGEINDTRVASLMDEILGQTQDPGLLTEALSFFVRFPSPDRRAILKNLSTNGQWEVSMIANIALTRLGDESARSQLKRLAKSPAHLIRQAMIQGINKHPMIEDRELFEIFFKDSHPHVRQTAISGLMLFNAEERLRWFQECISREKEESVKIALLKQAISEKNPKLYSEFVSFLSSSSEDLKQIGVCGLSAMRENVLDRILKDFDKMSLVVKEQMLLVLGFIGGAKAVETISKCLEADERWLKINSIEAIVKLGVRSFASKFSEMVAKEDDIWVRATLLSGLSKIGDACHLPLFVQNLSHQDPRVKANAIEGLMNLGGIEQKSRLESFLHDANDRVRVNAALALWKMGDRSILSSLVNLTKDPNKWKRSSTAFALGEICDKEATPALIELLSDKEEVVYRNVIDALAKIADLRALIPILRERLKKRIPESAFTEALEKFSARI